MMIFPLLRYLGKISQPEFSEFGFRIENEDKSVRLLILTIADSLFLTKQLMVQEAPDLCYQMVLTDLNSKSADPDKELISVTESDIEQYRIAHPYLKRRSFKKPSEYSAGPL
jgi:hypothetical protein